MSAEANLHTIILGRGVELGPEGETILSFGSVERADRATQDYFDRKAGYDDGGIIIASGGHPRLASDTFTHSEADLMADRMVQNGVPHGVIEKETTSTSTISNFMNSAPLLEGREITAANPLGVVTHAAHWRRASFFAGRVLDVPVQAIWTPGEEGAHRNIQEHVMGAVWRVALAGVEIGDIEKMRAREDRINAFADRARPVLSKIIK